HGEDLLPARRLLSRPIAARDRGHAHAVTFCLSSAETQHAETWPGDTVSSPGASRRQRSMAYWQRGWKEQPGGRRVRSGGCPWMGSSLARRGSSSLGTERSSPSV